MGSRRLGCRLAAGVVTLLLLVAVPGATGAPPSADAYVTQAVELYRRGNCRAAVELLKKATTIDPRNARAYAWLGLCYARMGRVKEAVEAFEKVITLAPASEDARLARAWLDRLRPPSPPAAPRVAGRAPTPSPAAPPTPRPSPTSPPPPTPPVTPSGPVYLVDLPSVTGVTDQNRPPRVQLFGQIYNRALTETRAWSFDRTRWRVVYNLNRRFGRFRALAGVADGAPEDFSATFEVRGDGVTLFQSRAKRVGDVPDTVDVDVTGVLQLELLVQASDNWLRSVTVVWADPHLLPPGAAAALPSPPPPPRPSPTSVPAQPSPGPTPPVPAVPPIGTPGPAASPTLRKITQHLLSSTAIALTEQLTTVFFALTPVERRTRMTVSITLQEQGEYLVAAALDEPQGRNPGLRVRPPGGGQVEAEQSPGRPTTVRFPARQGSLEIEVQTPDTSGRYLLALTVGRVSEPDPGATEAWYRISSRLLDLARRLEEEGYEFVDGGIRWIPRGRRLEWVFSADAASSYLVRGWGDDLNLIDLDLIVTPPSGVQVKDEAPDNTPSVRLPGGRGGRMRVELVPSQMRAGARGGYAAFVVGRR